MKYILCTILLLVAVSVAGQDRRMDEQLDMYEYLCGQCLDIKSKVASGENVSRSLITSLIDSFLAQNKVLKLRQTDMTAAQRQRFADIGQWFSTGVKPLRAGPVPEVHGELLSCPAAEAPHGDICAGLGGLPQVSDGNAEGAHEGTESASDRPRGDIFLLASLTAPDMSYGLMAGYLHKRIGGYVCFRSNYIFGSTSYTCNSDGIMPSGGSVWPSGVQRRSNLNVSAGLLAGATRRLTFYVGAGYGYRKLAWEDVDGQWAQVSDWSHSGFAAECGAVVSIRKFALSAGVSTISFRTAAFTCGVGVRF